MADVFLSHSRADRSRVARLAEALTAAGLTVWWDRHLEPGAEFSLDIERELKAARAVVVCWSAEAVKSRWVRDEAEVAAEAGKLLAISLDREAPPIGFRQFHAEDLSLWNGRADAAELSALISVVKARLGEPASEMGVTAPAAPSTPERSPLGLGLAALLLGLAAVLGWRFLMGLDESATSTGSTSIAVLPFEALSDDVSDEYFGKGVAEELLNALARLPDLAVAGRTSAFSFEGSEVDPLAAARALGVAHVVTGSVRRSGDRLRVTAQLFGTESGVRMWSRTYEDAVVDLFELEDQLVRDIGRSLEVRLGVGAGAGRARREGVNPAAYEQYLKGLTLWGDRDRADNNRALAMEALENAVALDPDFGGAWAAIGVAGTFTPAFNLRRDPEAYLRQIEHAYQRAAELDPDNGVMHAGLSVWYVNRRIDVAAAQRHLAQAQALAPNRAETHYTAAHVWTALGDVDKALTSYQQAIVLDPLNMVARRTHAQFLSMIGRHDEAGQFFDECQATQCLAEGFPAYGMSAALFSGDPERITRWREVFRKLEDRFDTLPVEAWPPPLLVYPASVAVALDEADAPEKVRFAKAVLEDRPVGFAVGQWTPLLARSLPPALILPSLEAAQRTGQLLGDPLSFAPYYGANPYPTEILEHPRFAALWQQPGMPELAALRRANGWPQGLPPAR